MSSDPQEPGSTSWRRKAVRWWYVLRYYRPSQLLMRLVRRAQTRTTCAIWGPRCARPLDALPILRNHAALESLSRRKVAGRSGEATSQTAQQVLQGHYAFLGVERHLPEPIDWRLADWPQAAHLWRFHLHYQEYLLDLAAEGLRHDEGPWFESAWRLALDWIDHNRLNDRRVLRDAWHPFCISRRLPAWVHLWQVSPPAPAHRERILTSMVWQTRFLERRLEYDLRGNHLLENVRALALMGAFLEGPDADRWLKKAAVLVRREIAEQVLPHGEHFERSPMYHVQALDALVDVAEALTGLFPDVSRLCRQRAGQMAGFLRRILHPDGEIPLLGDSCLGQNATIAQLLAAAGPPREGESAAGLASASLPSGSLPSASLVGDYWLYRHGEDFLLFDAGPVGPDHLPAHAHADLLALEGSIGGRRLLVDGGVFSYDDEPVRRYCRSTAAHNALQIDHADQCDVWSRFRMGYRGRCSGLCAGEHEGFHWARAGHNAYRRLGVPFVGRWLACRPGGPWLCVDWALGSGSHALTSRLHFHPEVVLQRALDDELHLAIAGRRLRLRWLTPGQVTLGEGCYCPQIGRRQAAPVVCWERFQSLPAFCGWCLTWGDDQGAAAVEQDASGNVILRWSDRGRTIEFAPFAESQFRSS